MNKKEIFICTIITILGVVFLYSYIMTPRHLDRDPNIPSEFYNINLAPYEIPWMSSGWYIQVRADTLPSINPDNDTIDISVYTGIYYGKLDNLNPINDHLILGNEMREWIENDNNEYWLHSRMELAKQSFRLQIVYQLHMVNPKREWAISFPKG